MDADDLFGLALDQFIPERSALAKSLRAKGRRDEAKEVAATRKPSVAAWAVNQLVRTQGRAADKLFDAGDALRAAQDQVLAGQGDRQGLRAAAESERQAVEELLKAARGLLTSDGDQLSPAVIERVGETLDAAALDDDARRQVQSGRLERELRHVGFGAGAGAAPSPAPAQRSRPKRGASATAKQAGKAEPDQAERRQQDREARRRAERERADAVKAARAAEGEARRAAQRAARALELAQERRDRAAEALNGAEAELEQAHANADATVSAHRAATTELERLSDRQRTS